MKYPVSDPCCIMNDAPLSTLFIAHLSPTVSPSTGGKLRMDIAGTRVKLSVFTGAMSTEYFKFLQSSSENNKPKEPSIEPASKIRSPHSSSPAKQPPAKYSA